MDSGLEGGQRAQGTVRRARRGRVWGGVLLVGFGLGAVALRAVVLMPVAIEGRSMEPTVRDGDVAVVWRRTDVARDLDVGDLVVFRDPDGALALKRVVGMPGDRVALRDTVLEVDGRTVDEPYVDRSLVAGTYYGPVTVPAGSVLVMGDNRGSSIDSRDYGPVDAEQIIGRVLAHW